MRFQSTLSVRRATCHPHLRPQFVGISIHALREESDHGDVAFWNGAGIFQSTLSVRRATAPANNNVTIIPHFNPRSP